MCKAKNQLATGNKICYFLFNVYNFSIKNPWWKVLYKLINTNLVVIIIIMYLRISNYVPRAIVPLSEVIYGTGQYGFFVLDFNLSLVLTSTGCTVTQLEYLTRCDSEVPSIQLDTDAEYLTETHCEWQEL